MHDDYVEYLHSLDLLIKNKSDNTNKEKEDIPCWLSVKYESGILHRIVDRLEKSVFWSNRIFIAWSHNWITCSRVCGTNGLTGSSIIGFRGLSTRGSSAKTIHYSIYTEVTDRLMSSSSLQ